MNELLENITWKSLSGPQAGFSAGTSRARRYAKGFSPIIGFSDLSDPDFGGLAAYCEVGEHFYCPGWAGKTPAGWQVDAESTIIVMAWELPAPAIDEAPEAVRLGEEHLPQVLALADLTQPGPFDVRTIELGEYFGFLEEGRLVSMAGERMYSGLMREISGVCTHPAFQGQGLGRRLMLKLVRRQMQRKEMPFLHVMGENVAARRLYEHMGFRTYKEMVVRVMSRC